MQGKSIRRASGLLVTGILLCVATANAEIRKFEATVESETKEFVGGSSSDSEYAFDSFPGISTSNLPMTTQVGFTRTDSSGKITAESRAITTFSDPRISPLPSPEEFGISALAHSSDASLSHESRCQSTETREVVFTAADTGLTDGRAIRVRSQFFLDGIVVMWTNAGVSDLTNVVSKLRLDVVQERSTTGSATVLTAKITLTGTPGGKADLQTDGGVTPDNLVILDLNGSVSNLGAIQGVLIPAIAIPYEYDATVGESFTLKATIESVANSEPAGRGAAVVLGVALQDLSALVNNVVGGSVGSTFAGSLQLAAQTARPKVPLPLGKGIEITALPDNGSGDNTGTNDNPLRPLCGALGLEIPVMLGALGTMTFLSRRRSL